MNVELEPYSAYWLLDKVREASGLHTVEEVVNRAECGYYAWTSDNRTILKLWKIYLSGREGE